MGRWAFGPGRGPWARGRPSREDWLTWLEEYQKDLEQEAADVADLLRRLKGDAPQPEQRTETSTV